MRYKYYLAGGDDALEFAVHGGNVRNLKYLLKQGASLKTAMKFVCDNSEPFEAQAGILNVINALVELGADVNAKGTNLYESPMLVLAASQRNMDLIAALIQHGADVDAKNRQGYTALTMAANVGACELALELIRHGADINVKSYGGETPLMLAAEFNHIDVVAALLRHGADTNAKDDRDRTALMCAAMKGAHEVAAQLISHGADTDAKDKNGKTALMLAVHAHTNNTATVAVFFRLDTPDEQPDGLSSNEVDLLTDKACGDIDALQPAVAMSSNLECATRDGKTALCYAAALGQTNAVQFLIDKGANVDVKLNTSQHSRREYDTPLTLAGRAGHMQTLEALVRGGASVHVRSAVDGETPLVSCARFNSFPAVSLLMAHGGSDLCIDDVQDDAYALLPGSLATMATLCAVVTFEFQPMCSRLISRLQSVCSALKQQQQQDSHPQHSEGVLVTFARIVYRVARLLFDIEKKRSVLERFIASRAIVRRIDDISDEMDNFVRMQALAHTALESAMSDLKMRDDDDCDSPLQQLQLRFEQALSSDDVLVDDALLDSSGYNKITSETALLLKYELLLQQREQRQQTRTKFIESVLTRFLQVNNAKEPDVPAWFVSRDDLEFHSWNCVVTSTFLTRYEGTWHGTNVTIDVIRVIYIVPTVAVWHTLKHPNIVELFGACPIGVSQLYIYESIRDGQPLHEFLRANESNRAHKFRCLYDTALGLQYLHSRGVAHGCLQAETIIVGSDMVTRLNNIGAKRIALNSNERSSTIWESPEQQQYVVPPTAESDVYAFGVCIWEAVTLELPWNGWDYKLHVLPDRPAHMSAATWSLVNDMCADDPSDRVRIAEVVRRLKHLLLAHEKGTSSDVSQDIYSAGSSKSNDTQLPGLSQRIDEHVFVELGRTIPTTLELVTSRCEKLDDAQWILVNVLPALEFVFDLLQQRESAVADADVVAFCTVLGRLWRYVRTSISDKSVNERMRSRKVAASHRLVYVELDQLLDSLQVSTDDPIRSWRLELASSIISAGSPNGPAAAANEIDSTPITLNHLDTPLATYKQWTQAGLQEAATLEAPDWRPAWYLSLRELVFSEADKLGQGSFGAVYRGRWQDAPVVIKFMGYDDDIETIETDMLLHEVRVWHRLNHPHVLKFYGASHVDKRYFVCELAGDELSKYLEQPGNEHLVWHKLHEAALGLKYLHDNGVAHNDLKGDNILVARDGKAKLIDFGMSCLLDEAEIQVAKQSIGAVNWRSPEYLTGGRPSRASDVYSFAMCIIEAVGREAPWGAMAPVGIKFKVRKGNKPPLPASMTPKQRDLIERMTTLDPAVRVSMTVVVNALHEFAQDERGMQAP